MVSTNDFLSNEKIEKIIAARCSTNEKCLYKVVFYIDNNRFLTAKMYLFAVALLLCETITITAAINILLNPDRYLAEISVWEFLLRIMLLSGFFISFGIYMILRANKIRACGRIPQYYIITGTRFLKISVGFFCGASTFTSMDWGGFKKATCYGFNSVILYPHSDEISALKIDTNSVEEAIAVADMINRLIIYFSSQEK